MADVILFAPRSKVAPISQETPPARGAAMILFFTGVRYERQAEAAAADRRAPRKRRSPPREGRAKSAGQPV